jgi:hypothetical protein
MTKLGNALRAAALAAAALAATAAGAQAPIEATTGSGERVLLHPDGRWEYADPAKRAASPKPASPTAATPAGGTAAATPVAAGACPPGSQGQLFGVGRCVAPGDGEYNRGSLSGKGR